ncbi:MAG: protein-disulfide reductase DsbD domain-containing protein [Gemmatimonas sp.]
MTKLVARIRSTVAAMLALGGIGASPTHAQVLPIEWDVRIIPGTVRLGEPATALVRAQIPYGWHLYSLSQPPGGPMPTEIIVSNSTFRLAGRVIARAPQKALDPVARIPTETYEDSVTFRVPVVASATGRHALELRVRYQSCTDRFCTPPQAATVRTTVTVAKSAVKQP